MPDLRTSLRSYVEQTVERVDLGDLVLQAGQPAPAERPTWWRRPLPVIAMSTLLVLFLLGGGALILGSLDTEVSPLATEVTGPSPPEPTPPPPSSTSPPTTTPPPTTVHATTSLPPAPTTLPAEPALPPLPAALMTSWSAVPTSPDLEGGAVIAVTEGGPGMVAVGGSRRGDAAAWVSSDGATWERIDSDSFRTEPDSSGMDGSQTMLDVVNGPLGLVAVGFDEHRADERHRVGFYRVAIWTSPDGRDWARVPDDPEIFGGIDADAAAVVYGGPGLVVVGQVDGGVAVWVSADGQVWERTDDIEGASDALMADVIEVDGMLIAVGSINRGGTPSWEIYSDAGTPVRPAVWVSSDGWTWDLLPAVATIEGSQIGLEIGDPEPGSQGYLQSIAATPDGLVVVGSLFSEEDRRAVRGSPQVWRSTNGSTFTKVASVFEQSDEAFPQHVTSVGKRLIVLSDPGLVYRTTAGVWGSVDQGATWHRLAEIDTDQPELRFQPPAMADTLVIEDTMLILGSEVVLVPKGEGGGDCYWGRIGSATQCRTDAAITFITFGTEE